jgi:hypothetical protein
MAVTEYRVLLTATFTTEAARNAVYTFLRTKLIEANNAYPGYMKRADMTKDDYMIAEIQDTEKVV